MRRTATLCTLPALSDGFTLRQSTGLSLNPTILSSTRRACCALTRLMSMSRGFCIASSMAGLVISWNTMRLVFSGFSSSTSYRCQLMASPSRSSSDASHTVLASEAIFLSWATIFALSSGISYCGEKVSVSTLNVLFFRSLM